jgi:hypothetical protein
MYEAMPITEYGAQDRFAFHQWQSRQGSSNETDITQKGLLKCCYENL